jgi:hypothetical protein
LKLVVDANVLLDFAYVGGLADFVQLGDVEVLDVVQAEVQLDSNMPDLLALGCSVIATQANWVTTALATKPSGLSLPDALCVYYAQTNRYTLLSNDKQVRTACTARGVVVHGTLWVAQELHSRQLCQPKQLCLWLAQWTGARGAYLPSKEVARLRQILGCLP